MALRSRTASDLGRIGILMGGPSSERDVSLKSGKAVYESLKGANLDVVAIDIETDNAEDNIKLIKSFNIDCAFLALHGRYGEDGQVQEILDSLGMPYTASGMYASKLAMDKVASRKIIEVHGLHVPRYVALNRVAYNSNWKIPGTFSCPLVIKPATHGSSIGLSIVDKDADVNKAVEFAFQFDEDILIEEYIEGRELTVGILDEKPLPIVEIIPKKRFFDFEAKYSAGMTEYVVPANLEKEIARKVQVVGLAVHKLLGCSGCSRVDIILSRDNTPYVLELNSIPGLTPTSLLPKAAKVAGIEFQQLCIKLIELAYEKAKASSAN